LLCNPLAFHNDKSLSIGRHSKPPGQIGQSHLKLSNRPVTEQTPVPVSIMSTIEAHRISGQKSPHQSRQTVGAAAQQKMGTMAETLYTKCAILAPKQKIKVAIMALNC
jgi:hypothetical protein